MWILPLGLLALSGSFQTPAKPADLSRVQGIHFVEFEKKLEFPVTAQTIMGAHDIRSFVLGNDDRLLEILHPNDYPSNLDPKNIRLRVDLLGGNAILVDANGNVQWGKAKYHLTPRAFYDLRVFIWRVLPKPELPAEPSETKDSSVVPKNGFVPDAPTAILVARAILIPLYGKPIVDKEEPLGAKDGGTVWIVSGSSATPQELGGVAEVRINKKTGQIIRVTHGK